MTIPFGTNSYLGSQVVRRLADAGDDVIGYDKTGSYPTC